MIGLSRHKPTNRSKEDDLLYRQGPVSTDANITPSRRTMQSMDETSRTQYNDAVIIRLSLNYSSFHRDILETIIVSLLRMTTRRVAVVDVFSHLEDTVS